MNEILPPTLVEDFVEKPTPRVLINFAQKCLSSVSNVEPFFQHLVNLAGVEIEGNEITLGLILTPHRRAVPFPNLQSAAISDSLKDTLRKHPVDFSTFQLGVVRSVMHVMRESILGWAPGNAEQPVLILDKQDLQIKTVKILSGGKSAHEAYIDITKRRPDTIAIWIKPSSSIRFYKEGRLVAQLMRVRDTSGWAARNLDVLAEYISKISRVGCLRDSRVVANKVLYPLVEMSEEKHGGSLYFIRRSCWRKIRTKQCESKHYGDTTLKIDKIEKQELSTYLRQDGCVVMDDSGSFLAAGTYFLCEGTGGRRATALAMARGDYQPSAFVVSQDGPLLYYSEDIPPNHRHPRGRREKTPKPAPYMRLDFFPLDVASLLKDAPALSSLPGRRHESKVTK